MPLPAALLLRLQKRGIVANTSNKQEDVEEVFAEDYDDLTKEAPEEPPVSPPTEEPPSPEPEPEPEPEKDEPLVHEVIACPNKSNPFHVCIDYCKERWGLKTFEADENMIKRRDRMLNNHPLPEGWEEVSDPNSGRYYYWHVQTDQVSWLSPSHPRAEISLPADKLQPEHTLVTTSELKSPFASDDELDMNEESDLSSLSSDSESEEEPQEPRKRKADEDKHGVDRDERNKRGRGRGRSRPEHELDPMDPASYSEVPRGTWSTGLDIRGEAKTGVDITASGPLFQQRPYPSPGDVLRANRAITDQKR